MISNKLQNVDIDGDGKIDHFYFSIWNQFLHAKHPLGWIRKLKVLIDGEDINPTLTIEDIPPEAKSLALIVDDPDAPMGTWVHWLIWNIKPNIKGFSKGENITFPQGKNDFGKLNYGGPCPPSGTHRYFFKLYALDTMLELGEGSNKKQLEKAMSDHIIEEGQIMGTYSR